MWRTVFLVFLFSLPAEAEEKVWYCEMTGFVVTDKAGFRSHQPERFTMRVTREQIVLKNGGIFTEPRSLAVALWSSVNGWDASSVTEKAFFQRRYLHYASASYQDRAIAFSARCEDF